MSGTTTADAARVAVWHGGDRVQTETVPLPEPGEGEVLVRVDLATVCGSDHHTVSGRRPGPCPSVLGHEGVGTVVAAGTSASVAVGGRVVWSVTVACGRCDRCRAGRTAKCRCLRKIGHEPYATSWPLSGTYATHVLLPAGTAVVPVPAAMSDLVAAPAGCATATVMAALEQAGDLTGRRVLVIGAGMLGLTAIAAAADGGGGPGGPADRVIALEVDPERRDLARAFGATTVLAPDEPLPPVDVALDLSGATSAIDAALDALDVGGTLVLVGSVSPGPALALDPERVVRRWQRIAGVHNYEPRHLEQAVRFLDASPRPWDELVDEPVGLGAVGRVLGSPMGRPRAGVRPSLTGG